MHGATGVVQHVFGQSVAGRTYSLGLDPFFQALFAQLMLEAAVSVVMRSANSGGV